MPPPEIQPPPEGVLIRRGREARRLSARKAAQLAGINDSRWTDIERGYYIPTKGVKVKTEALADTLARMAVVCQVTPQELEDAGRIDAAEVLEQFAGQGEADPIVTAIEDSWRLPPFYKKLLLDSYHSMLAELQGDASNDGDQRVPNAR